MGRLQRRFYEGFTDKRVISGVESGLEVEGDTGANLLNAQSLLVKIPEFKNTVSAKAGLCSLEIRLHWIS